MCTFAVRFVEPDRLHGGCSSAGRASDCGSECRGFESHHPPYNEGALPPLFVPVGHNPRGSRLCRICWRKYTASAGRLMTSCYGALPPLFVPVGHNRRAKALLLRAAGIKMPAVNTLATPAALFSMSIPDFLLGIAIGAKRYLLIISRLSFREMANPLSKRGH